MAALTAQQQNLISELETWADAELQQRSKAENIAARWNLNDVFNQIDDAGVEAVFPHLTKSKISNGINAVNAVVSALGDDVSGQAVNLIELKG